MGGRAEPLRGPSSPSRSVHREPTGSTEWTVVSPSRSSLVFGIEVSDQHATPSADGNR
jgi:hypothetical protein